MLNTETDSNGNPLCLLRSASTANIDIVGALVMFSIDDGIAYSTRKGGVMYGEPVTFHLDTQKIINATKSIHREGRAALAIFTVQLSTL